MGGKYKGICATHAYISFYFSPKEPIALFILTQLEFFSYLCVLESQHRPIFRGY